MLPETMPRLLLRNAAERGGFPAIRHKRLGIWRTWSWAEQADQVSWLAFGLASRGFGAGQRLAVFAENRPETYWSVCAAQLLRGVAVPLHADLGAEDLVAQLRAVPVTMAVAEGQEQVDKLLAARAVLPDLRTIVYVDARGLRDYGDQHVLASMASILADGRRLRQESPSRIEEAIAGSSGDDPAVVLHSSGVGGVVRPVTLTHAEIIASADSAAQLFRLSEDERVIALLPTSWWVDHQTSYVLSYRLGYCVHCPEARDTTLADLREVAPSYMALSPRLAEALLRIVDARMCTASAWRRRLVRAACEGGTRLGRTLVVRPLVDGLGLSRLRTAVLVGRKVDPVFAQRWRSLGLPLVSALGYTEAAGFPALLTDEGELGNAALGFEVATTDREISYRRAAGGSASPGPWQVTDDVVVHTRGRALVCRRDELLDVRSGRAVPPSLVEARLTATQGVRDALVVSDGQGGTAALIVPDHDQLSAWAAERRIPYSSPDSLARNEQLVQHFASIVAQLNLDLARDGLDDSRIGAFSLCFTPFESEDFGPSGQPRRRVLEARHAELLTRLRATHGACPEGWIDPTPLALAPGPLTPRPPLRESAA